MVRFLLAAVFGSVDGARITAQKVQQLQQSTEESAAESTLESVGESTQEFTGRWVQHGATHSWCSNGWTHHVLNEEVCREKAEKKGKTYYSFTKTGHGGRCKYQDKCKLKNAKKDDWVTYKIDRDATRPQGPITTPRNSKSQSLDEPDKAAEQAASDLNKIYYGFESSNSNSPHGIYMTMHSKFELFTKAACHNGWTNDRMSASIYNHKMMLKDGKPSITMGRDTGFILNAAAVESELATCSYMFDGATFNRQNRACGCNANVNTCGEKGNAFDNKCGPGFDHTCSPKDDEEVEQCSCDQVGVDTIQKSDQIQCFFKGPAYDRNNISQAHDQTRQMITERLKRQHITSSHGSQLTYWNELIIDTVLLEKMLRKTPNDVMHAFAYVKNRPGAEAHAKTMRNQFVAQWKVTKHVPVVGINNQAQVIRKESVFFA